jgi:5'-phosphate synthase pdxT subunit
MSLVVGVLALQGGVVEHVEATKSAIKKLKLNKESAASVQEIRTARDLENIDALIIPGGESTVLYKLIEREGMFEKLKGIRFIFGTCAGAILLARNVNGLENEQKTLGLMDIEIDRNGYGRQVDSFSEQLNTKLGTIDAIFIRAPRIKKIGKEVKALALKGNETIACEQQTPAGNYYLATCFHPELTTTVFHEYFLRKMISFSK